MKKIRKKILAIILSCSPKKILNLLFFIEDFNRQAINSVSMIYEKKCGTGRLIHPKHRLIKYHKFFISKIDKHENILDLGCGYGAVAFSIAQQIQGKVLGIDINPDNIEKAQKQFFLNNLEFKIGDGCYFNESKGFETIVLSNVLEHIHDRINFLKNCNLQLKPKRWLIRVPMKNRDWSVALRDELGLYSYLDRDHKIEYTRDSFLQEMQAVGMSVKTLDVQWGEIWSEVLV